MSSVAPPLRQRGARRAALIAVTVVHNLVVAVVAPGAPVRALWRPRSAGHGRKERLLAAVAAQLVERYMRARVTVPAVARVLASVRDISKIKESEVSVPGDKYLCKPQPRGLPHTRGQTWSTSMQHISLHLWRPQLRFREHRFSQRASSERVFSSAQGISRSMKPQRQRTSVIRDRELGLAVITVTIEFFDLTFPKILGRYAHLI